MEYIIKNAVIATMDRENPMAEAAVIKDGKFAFCGKLSDAEKTASEEAKVLDLGGKFMMPSFNDSHMHYLHYVKTKLSVDLWGTNSVMDIVERMKNAFEHFDRESGLWLVGEGWNHDYFTDGEKRFPTAKDLDEISLEHPVLIMRACYHIGVLNSKAMEIMGLDSEKAKELGAFCETDENGKPNGVIKENYFDEVKSKLPYPDLSILIKMMLECQNDLFEQGITAVQSDDMKYAPEGRAYEMIDELKKASIDGRLLVHYAEQALSQTKEEVDDWFCHEHYKMREGSFKVSCLKVISDGSLGARTAYQGMPYADDPKTEGIAIYTQDELDYYILEAQKRNTPAAIHAIGTGAMEMCLNAIENAKNAYPEYSPRHAIVHCQITTKEQVERLARLDIIALTQPVFIDYDMHIVYDRVGKELAETSYAWKDYLELGVHEAFGTDCPVENFKPMRGIYCAVTRNDCKGAGPYLPNQAVSVYDALYAYTAEGAYVSGDEDIRGKIKDGMEADFIVLDKNLLEIEPEEILSAKVLKTFIGGKCVFERGEC
ncbi:MAG: amidohydrolase [Oscillospiraceae bacterium]|nr:amidohydrolase [Oscillospiraceae bacterium]